ncbi:hypothetical protein DL93DRAFT_2078866 [Clavulina sp. PMI_390]|nr:hypothetical protein DL93DRAFT_2078866 [Clavulina sp. PMI_390]
MALLIPSIVILLAGTFLTLDRTRTFDSKPSADVEKQGPIYKTFTPERKKSFNPWQFHGGLGGMLLGFSLGLHVAALVALYIANRPSGTPLSSAVFMMAWILFGLVFLFLGCRWHVFALILTAILGSASFSLFLATAFHPTLHSRFILFAMSAVVALLGTFLPIFKERQLNCWTTRACVACSGSLGIVVAISLFSGEAGWASVWLRFIVSDGGPAWTTSKEKGFAFLFVLIAVVGAASDWWIQRKYGEDSDPKWEDYLSRVPSFTTSPEGVFKTRHSMWARMFHEKKKHQTLPNREPRLPSVVDSYEGLPPDSVTDEGQNDPSWDYQYYDPPPAPHFSPAPSYSYEYPVSPVQPFPNLYTRPLSAPPQMSTTFLGDPTKRPLNLPERADSPRPLSLPPRFSGPSSPVSGKERPPRGARPRLFGSPFSYSSPASPHDAHWAPPSSQDPNISYPDPTASYVDQPPGLEPDRQAKRPPLRAASTKIPPRAHMKIPSPRPTLTESESSSSCSSDPTSVPAQPSENLSTSTASLGTNESNTTGTTSLGRPLSTPTLLRPAQSFISASSSSLSREVILEVEENGPSRLDGKTNAKGATSNDQSTKLPEGTGPAPPASQLPVDLEDEADADESRYGQSPSLLRAYERIRRARAVTKGKGKADREASSHSDRAGPAATAPPNDDSPRESTHATQNASGTQQSASTASLRPLTPVNSIRLEDPGPSSRPRPVTLATSTGRQKSPPLSPLFEEAEWENFWRDVHSKAAAPVVR